MQWNAQRAVTLGKVGLDFKLRIPPNAPVPAPAQPSCVELRQSRRFGLSALGVIYSFGLLLAVPIVFSVLGMTLMPASVWSLVLPVIGLGLTAFFLPFGQGNLYVAFLASRIVGRPPRDNEFVVQITFCPRLHPGLRGFLETADDLGYLSFSSSGVVYCGDAVQMNVPWAKVRAAGAEGIGWRGLFLYSKSLAITIEDSDHEYTCEFTERSCWTLLCSHSVMRRMHAQFEKAGQQQQS